jgi:hypothetical protein
MLTRQKNPAISGGALCSAAPRGQGQAGLGSQCQAAARRATREFIKSYSIELMPHEKEESALRNKLVVTKVKE